MRLDAILLLSFLTITGCSTDSSSDSAAAETATEGKDDLTAIQTNLAALREPRLWSGERWKTTGLQGGYPVTESIGGWEIEVVPAENEMVIELRGIRIGEPKSVQLDLSKGVLLIDGESFSGRAVTGKSPVVRDAPFKGAIFERQNGNVTGKASILLLEDGRVLVDFYRVWAKGKRGEYGVLSADKSGRGDPGR